MDCFCSSAPPSGCTQYFTGAAGVIKSYNYGTDDDYHHLAAQVYTICVRRESGYCKIGYIPSNDGNSFYLSFNPNTANSVFKSRAGESGCVADFISIPRGRNSLHGGGLGCLTAPVSTPPQIASFAVETINRYCGQRLNCVSGSVENSWIYSDVLPFEIGVELNGAEPSTGPAPDNKNRGFSLDYLQQPC